MSQQPPSAPSAAGSNQGPASNDILSANYAQSPFPLTKTEISILTEYQKLARNMNLLSNQIETLINPGTPTPLLLDRLRGLEVKVGLVFTLFKTSLYNMFLQREEDIEQRQREMGMMSDADDVEGIRSGLGGMSVSATNSDQFYDGYDDDVRNQQQLL